MKCLRLLPFLLLASTTVAAWAAPFEITDGDRVLLLGDALLERENTYGYLETRMHEQFPAVKFTVRNLSWSGETPKGWSRASFDGPAKGWERLQQQIAEVKPTVVFLGFGMAATLQELTDRSGDMTLNPDPVRYGAEPMSAGRFKKELGELMDAIDKTAGGGKKVRYVLLSPIAHEDLRRVRPGLPDPTAHNVLLKNYSGKIEELAKERGGAYIASKETWIDGPPLETDNGIQLTGPGYQLLCNQVISPTLGWAAGRPEGAVSPLRAAILKKDDLFFHQFRPANSTYLFGFRRGEQGRNAVEMPKFTPLIEAEDTAIDHLKRLPSSIDGTPPNAAPQAVNLEDLKDPLPDLQAFAFKAPQGTPKATLIVLPGPRYQFGKLETASLAELRKPLAEFAASDSPTLLVRAAKSAPYADVKAALAAVSDAKITSVAFATDAAAPLPLPDFKVADGFEITLWADTPLVGKPVGMNWDAAGRLWLACSPVYPQIAPGAHPDDKVVVLEDTDHDGKADKSTTFATDLLIATSVAPDFATPQAPIQAGAKNPARSLSAPTAAYVATSTEFVRLEDTDGDGKADTRRIVLSGFGTEDTHHVLHTLRWGPDGRLYFQQSIYIHSHMETPWGMVRLNSGGICAYDPRTERVEVTARGFVNTWGHAWDQFGQEFATDGAGGAGINWLVPGGMFTTYEGARRTLPSVSPGGYPKFCSLELIQSPLFPKEWQGNAITCDFRAHKLLRFQITDLGVAGDSNGKAGELKSGYITKELANPVVTADATFRPIDLKLGPDGALYIADWTNPIINHGEVDFRDPRRDHVHGRVWRLAPKGSTPPKWESKVTKSAAELMDQRLSENAWDAQQANQILHARAEAATRAWAGVYGKADPVHTAVVGAIFDNGQAKYFSDGNAVPWAAAQTTEVARLSALRLFAGLDSFPLHPRGIFDNLEVTNLADVKAQAAKLENLVPQLVASQDPRVRAIVCREIGVFAWKRNVHDENERRQVELREALAMLAKLARDEHPRVRLEAMRALSRIPTKESAEFVLEAALKAPAGDPYYEYAAWHSVNDLAPQVIEWIENQAAKKTAAVTPASETPAPKTPVPAAKPSPYLQEAREEFAKVSKASAKELIANYRQVLVDIGERKKEDDQTRKELAVIAAAKKAGQTLTPVQTELWERVHNPKECRAPLPPAAKVEAYIMVLTEIAGGTPEAAPAPKNADQPADEKKVQQPKEPEGKSAWIKKLESVATLSEAETRALLADSRHLSDAIRKCSKDQQLRELAVAIDAQRPLTPGQSGLRESFETSTGYSLPLPSMTEVQTAIGTLAKKLGKQDEATILSQAMAAKAPDRAARALAEFRAELKRREDEKKILDWLDEISSKMTSGASLTVAENARFEDLKKMALTSPEEPSLAGLSTGDLEVFVLVLAEKLEGNPASIAEPQATNPTTPAPATPAKPAGEKAAKPDQASKARLRKEFAALSKEQAAVLLEEKREVLQKLPEKEMAMEEANLRRELRGLTLKARKALDRALTAEEEKELKDYEDGVGVFCPVLPYEQLEEEISVLSELVEGMPQAANLEAPKAIREAMPESILPWYVKAETPASAQAQGDAVPPASVKAETPSNAQTQAQRDAMTAYALQALRPEQTTALLAKIVAKNGVPKDGSGPWIELIGQAGGAAELRALVDGLRANSPATFSSPEVARRAAAALLAAAKRNAKPDSAPFGKPEFYEQAPKEAANDLLRAAGYWKENVAVLTARIAPKQDAGTLDAAFEGLRTRGNDDAAKALSAYLAAGADSSPELRRRALTALAAFRAEAALAALPQIAAEENAGTSATLWRQLFASDKFNAAFLAKVPALPREQAAAALKASRELGKRGEKLTAALTPLAADSTVAAVPGAGDIAALVALTKAKGRPVEGELVYRRVALTCTVCHAIGGAGGKVGPELMTIGASAPLDYIIESVINPAVKVKEGYHAVAVSIKGGQTVSGTIARETDRDLVLRDLLGAEQTVAKSTITDRTNIGSLMPPGLTATLNDQEKADLFAFLAQLGKPGPFDASKPTVARTWRIFPGAVADAVISGKADARQAVPVLSYTDGRVTRDLLAPAVQAAPGDTVVATARFNLAAAGQARLKLSGATKAWLDGAPLAIASDPNPVVDLPAGDHVLAIKLDTKALPETLRAESPEARFLTD